MFALCGRLCKPPTVWSFQKVAPPEDRWHCKCIRVPLHWKVRSEEGGNVSQESKVGLHKARVPNPLAHGTSEAKISLGCSKKQNWNVTISIWNQGFRVQESERELSRCVWRTSLESKVWISERKPEGSGDRRADKATVEKRMKSWATYHLNIKYFSPEYIHLRNLWNWYWYLKMQVKQEVLHWNLISIATYEDIVAAKISLSRPTLHTLYTNSRLFSFEPPRFWNYSL